MTGRPQALRDAQRLRPVDEQPIVLMQFTDEGGRIGSGTSRPSEGARGPARTRRAAATGPDACSTSRSSSTTRSSRSRHRLQPEPERHLGVQRRADHRHRLGWTRRRTSRSCCRRARCPSSSTLEQTQVSATLGEGLAPPGDGRAAIGLSLVALFLLLVYRFLGLVAVIGLAIYAAFLYGADPALQRHADAPGLRRHDPHDRGRGRREHRHLRTHQGRVARGQVRARRDRHGLRKGFLDDHRRERRDGDHGARAVRGRDGRASRASRSCS